MLSAAVLRTPSLRPAGFAFLLALGGFSQSEAQTRIYTCVDSSGRTLTSDRPIPECADRPQRELNPSGTVRAVVQPAPTAAERAAEEERERKRLEEVQQAAEQRRRERTLLLRFPDEASHQRAREAALRQIDSVITSGEAMVRELVAQGKKLQQEAEFYKDAPARMPAALRTQIKDNTQFVETQRRLLDGQRAERDRLSTRFDDELAQLRRLWSQQAGTGGGTGGPQGGASAPGTPGAPGAPGSTSAPRAPASR